MIVYLFKVSYDSLWCQSLMVWYTAFLPATLSILYVKSTQNFQQIQKLTFIYCRMSPVFSQKKCYFYNILTTNFIWQTIISSYR